MMNCHSRKGLITSYVSGDLTGSTKDELEEHILECPSCRAELSIARSLESLLEGQPLVPAPAGLKDRIVRSIDMPGESFLAVLNDRMVRLRRKYIRREEILRLAAVSAVVILLSVVLGQGYDSIARIVSSLSREEVLKSSLSLLGTVNGGFNITYFNPVFVLLSILYGLVSISGHLNPRFTRAVSSILRPW